MSRKMLSAAMRSSTGSISFHNHMHTLIKAAPSTLCITHGDSMRDRGVCGRHDGMGRWVEGSLRAPLFPGMALHPCPCPTHALANNTWCTARRQLPPARCWDVVDHIDEPVRWRRGGALSDERRREQTTATGTTMRRKKAATTNVRTMRRADRMREDEINAHIVDRVAPARGVECVQGTITLTVVRLCGWLKSNKCEAYQCRRRGTQDM